MANKSKAKSKAPAAAAGSLQRTVGRRKGAANWSTYELKRLGEEVGNILPQTSHEWDQVSHELATGETPIDRNGMACNRKHSTLAAKKTPTGDPSIPEPVCK